MNQTREIHNGNPLSRHMKRYP